MIYDPVNRKMNVGYNTHNGVRDSDKRLATIVTNILLKAGADNISSSSEYVRINPSDSHRQITSLTNINTDAHSFYKLVKNGFPGRMIERTDDSVTIGTSRITRNHPQCYNKSVSGEEIVKIRPVYRQ